MNCPSRDDTDAEPHDGYNQTPPPFPSDTTPRGALNHRANRRSMRSSTDASSSDTHDMEHTLTDEHVGVISGARNRTSGGVRKGTRAAVIGETASATHRRASPTADDAFLFKRQAENAYARVKRVLLKYCKFVGPGFMVAVAYIDPGAFTLKHSPAKLDIDQPQSV